MAQQEGGWPLGLQPLNMRVGLARNREMSGSISFSTLITDSSSFSSVSSSDLDTQMYSQSSSSSSKPCPKLIGSTGSFFPDRSTTLGNLIGVTSILQLSSRRPESSEMKKNCRARTWLFSLCTKACADKYCSSPNNIPQSLGQYLEVERRAAASVWQRKKRNPPNFIEKCQCLY